ncbi:hypothetical protein KSS87_019999, partial [Heliosperma pusillum]
MIHMLLFCGEPFDCDLGTIMHTGLYRAEIAATLILSDINNVRKEVMSRVSDFTAAKAELASQMSGAGKSGITISLKRSSGTELARTPDKRMRSTDTMEEADVTAVPIRSAGSLNDTCVRSRRRGRGDGLGCTLQCGDVEENVLLVARSLRLNLTLLKNVQTLRKHVVDYCFLDDWNYAHNEQLVNYNRHAALTRANMLTMLPDVGLCDAVIECWSMLMNRLETDEYDFQRMSFFVIGHMEYLNQLLQSADQTTQDDTVLDNLYEMWDLYIQDSQDIFNLNADLLFVPFNIEGHFACVCFNSKAGTIDLLDHQLHPDPNKSKICKLASLI